MENMEKINLMKEKYIELWKKLWLNTEILDSIEKEFKEKETPEMEKKEAPKIKVWIIKEEKKEAPEIKVWIVKEKEEESPLMVMLRKNVH